MSKRLHYADIADVSDRDESVHLPERWRQDEEPRRRRGQAQVRREEEHPPRQRRRPNRDPDPS